MPAGFAEAFFASTVVEAVPPEVRAFLGEAAHLDALSAPLVEAAFGREQVAAFLRCRDEFMVLAPSARGGFLEVPPILRVPLRTLAPAADRREAVLLRASRWHLDRDEADLAIEYLLLARRPDEAAAILQARGPHIRSQTGDNPKMLQWLDRIALLGGTVGPELQLWRVWALAYSLRLDEAESLLDTVLPVFEGTDRSSRAFGERPRISIAARRGQVDLTETLATAWLETWAEKFPVQAAGVALMLALVHAYRCADRPCRRMLLLSRQYAVQGGNDAANLWTMGLEALIELDAGRTVLAGDIIERAHSVATQVGGLASPVSRMLSVIAAAIYLELDDLDAVGRHLAHGYASTPVYGLPETHLAAHVAMAGYTEQTAGPNAALLNLHQKGITGWRYAQAGHLLAVRLLTRAGRVEEARRFGLI